MPDVLLGDVIILGPGQLCNYLEHDLYNDIRRTLQKVQNCISGAREDVGAASHADLLNLLFIRLNGETHQMMQNDELVIFPLIRNDKGVKPCPARKLPVEVMRQMHREIMQLLEKVRSLFNNYIEENSWNKALKITCNEMLDLDLQLQKAVQIKEQVLLDKIKDDFNGKCSGNCKNDKNPKE